MKKGLISVIVPVYNTADFLPRTIESILTQTFRNLELILVDDGSTDSSGAICDEYAINDNRIVVLHQENKGVSAARNIGIDVAQGEWIGFVDSDDYIEPFMYEKLLNTAIQNDVLISAGELIRITPTSEEANYLEYSDDYIQSVKVSAILYLEHALHMLTKYWFCSSLFHISIFSGNDAVRFDEKLHFVEDWLFVTETALKVDFISVIPETLYTYVIRDGSAAHSAVTLKHMSGFDGDEKLLKLISPISEKLTVEIKSFFTSVAVIFINNTLKCKQYNPELLPKLKRNLRKYAHIYVFKSDHAIKDKVYVLMLLISIRIAYKTKCILDKIHK